MGAICTQSDGYYCSILVSGTRMNNDVIQDIFDQRNAKLNTSTPLPKTNKLDKLI